MTTVIPTWVEGTLTPVEKLEAHRKGLCHMAVSVFVLREDEVLLQRRAMGKYHTPGLWANTCCTHPAWDEKPADCAVRRLSEELGISGLVPVHRDRIEYRADVGGGMIEHEIVDLFTAEAGSGLVVTPNPDEVMATRWTDYETLSTEVSRHPERFTPWLRIYVEEHGPQIFGSSA